jgi:hypothetical protein
MLMLIYFEYKYLADEANTTDSSPLNFILVFLFVPWSGVRLIPVTD